MKKMAMVFGVVIAVTLFVSNVLGNQTAKANPYKKLLQNVPVLELPAKASELVKQAKETDRKDVTVEIIAAISEMKPAAVTAVVGTIARTVPQQAATAAATAVKYQPVLAPLLVKTSVGIVPGEASAIVMEVCRVAPAQFQMIAVAASEAAPKSSARIITAVGTAIPALKPAIDQAVTGNAAKEASVAVVMSTALRTAGTAMMFETASIKAAAADGNVSGAVAAPIVGPPFKTLQSTPGEVTPSGTVQVPTGGRNYAVSE